MSLLVRVPLRWGDLDAQGHVNNGGFIDYLQEARADFLLEGPNAHMLSDGVVVVSHQIEYAAPISFTPEPAEVEVRITEVGGARFALSYEIRHEGSVRAKARTLLCPFDFGTGLPRRMTPDERSHFASLVEPDEPWRQVVRKKVTDTAATMPLRVRWSDLDSYGHVNNVRFFDYMQEGRISITTLLDPGMARGGAEPEAMWLVARQDVEYKRQLDFRREPYTVRTGVAAVGEKSVTFNSEITDGTNVYATAGTVLVCGGLDGRPMRVPDPWRERLASITI